MKGIEVKNNITIIMYHYVRDLANSQYPEIKGLDIQLFSEQILFLKNHYNIIKMEELVASLENNFELPTKAALLTFDDAYIDHYTYVFPVLQKHKIQGSFYPPIKALTENLVLDVNKIHFILAKIQDKDLIVSEIYKQLDIFREKYNLESNKYYYDKLAISDRMDTATVIFIKRLLQVELIEPLRLLITDYLFKKYVSNDEATFSASLYMNETQIKKMFDAGMHIGSHGFNHYWLSKLDQNQQKLEIEKSISFLKGIGVNANSWTMCYPYGDYDDNIIEILKQSGCKLGLTTRVDVANISTDNPFKLPRLDTNDIPKAKDARPNEWYQNIS